GKEIDIGMDRGCDKALCPTDMLLYLCDGGLDVCVDLTGSSPLTQTRMVDFAPGRAVIDAAQRKRVKYEAKCATVRCGFLSFSFSFLGELKGDVVTLLKRIRKFSMAQDIRTRATVHIFYRIGFAVAKRSFHFDILSFSRPPAKPPDGNTGILNIKMMGDISEQKVPIPGLMITLVPNQEKSPDLLSHQGLEAFQLSAKCPMMIHGKNIPILDVPLFHFYTLDQLKYGGNWIKLSDLKQALRGRHPMLIRSLVFSNK
nr:hypothetical protein [Tanacetum cinerariifolium]